MTYDSGSIFQFKCRFGKDFNLLFAPNIDSISLAYLAYLPPKLRVSPSDGWEDELPKFQCGGEVVSSLNCMCDRV